MDEFKNVSIKMEWDTRYRMIKGQPFDIVNARPGFLYFTEFNYKYTRIESIPNISDVRFFRWDEKIYKIGFETPDKTVINIFGNQLGKFNDTIDEFTITNNEVLTFNHGITLANDDEAVMRKVLFNGSSFITSNGNKYDLNHVVFLQFIDSSEPNIDNYTPIYLSTLLKQYNEKHFIDRPDAKLLTDLKNKMKTLQNKYIEEIAIEKEKYIHVLMSFKNISPIVSKFYIKNEKQTIEISPGEFSYLLYDDSFLYKLGFDKDTVIQKFPKDIFLRKVNSCIIKLFFSSLYNSKFPTVHEILKCDQIDIFLIIETLYLLAVYFGIKIYDRYYRDLLPASYIN